MTTDNLLLRRARPAVLALKAYSSARSLSTPAEGTVFLDANEFPIEPLIGAQGYARYAPQQPSDLIAAVAALYGVAENQVLASRGADEAIDILIRSFCEAGEDNIILCPPTFPMYAQSAGLQGAEVKSVPLRADFTPDAAAILAVVTENTKIVFLCSHNNPTGTPVDKNIVRKLCRELAGRVLVVVDEAYVEFSGEESCTALLAEYSNLAVLRTLSKTYALAGVRCGVLLAEAGLAALCRKVLAPYPLPVPVVETVLKTLSPPNRLRLEKQRQDVIATRDWFARALAAIPGVTKVFPSAANFVLARLKNLPEALAACKKNNFILRDQSHQAGLENCVRISIGTREQMEDLLAVLGTGQKAERPQGRAGAVTRRTKETAISAAVNLDRAEPVRISTGVGFYDHMLEQVARHGGFSLVLDCVGDLHIDSHHTIEDCAIAFGLALKQALGDKAGLARFGFVLPMDEARAEALIDLSGRNFFKFDGAFPEGKVGDFPTDMVAHVFRSIAENLQANIHLSVTGENTHHMVESCFKAFGRALRQAVRREGDAIPSTKGVL